SQAVPRTLCLYITATTGSRGYRLTSTAATLIRTIIAAMVIMPGFRIQPPSLEIPGMMMTSERLLIYTLNIKIQRANGKHFLKQRLYFSRNLLLIQREEVSIIFLSTVLPRLSYSMLKLLAEHREHLPHWRLSV